MKPFSVPLTSRLDLIKTERPAITERLMRYLDTDLLCYRAGPLPEGQAKAQEKQWDPWLKWFEKRFGVPLKTTRDLHALNQPQEAHTKIHDYVVGLSDGHFAVLQAIVPLSGSLVLGLAFVEKAIDADTVFSAMRVEEHFKAQIYNEDFYGPDPMQEKKDEAARKDLKDAADFLEES